MDEISRKGIQLLTHTKACLTSWFRVGVGMAFLAATGYAVGELAIFEASRSFHLSIVLFANGTISLILFFIFTIIQPPRIRMHVRHLPGIFFGGFLHTFGQITTIFADVYIGPGNSASLYYTMPIFAAVFSYVFLNCEIQKIHVISAGLSTMGVFILTRSSSEQITSPNANGYWTAFGMCSALAGAASHAGSLTIRKKLKDCDIESSVFVLSFLLQYSLSSTIYCTLSGAWKTTCASRIDLAMLVVCGLPAYFATLCLFIAVSLENPATVSIILTASIFMVNAGQKILFPYIPFGWTSIVGAILIFFSCVLVASIGHEESSVKEEGNCEMFLLKKDERWPMKEG